MLYGFFCLMVKEHLSIKHNLQRKKGLLAFLIPFLTLFFTTSRLNAQGEFQFGAIGGMNMSTITAKNDDSGFKVGFNIGGIAQYKIDKNSYIAANISFTSRGQQYSKIRENATDYIKYYHSTTLYYIDIPIFFQYYVKDIIGLEIGPTFGFCLGGKDKSKIGNESWTEMKFDKDIYNTLDLGLSFGVFSHDLSHSETSNFFIEIRYFLGLTNFIKNYDRNINNGILINIGYIIEKPLKRKK